MYSRILALKKTNNIKVLLAVGGWNFGSGPFSDMVMDQRLRREFVEHATKFIIDRQFDGLDLDWVKEKFVERIIISNISLGISGKS